MDTTPPTVATDPPNKITIAVLGSLNTDIIIRTSRVPAPGETVPAASMSTGCGGKGANQAVAIRRMTAPAPTSAQAEPAADGAGEIQISTRLYGAVGSDSFGESLLSQLRADGVDVSAVQKIEGESGTAVVTVTDDGENAIMVVGGANMRYGLGKKGDGEGESEDVQTVLRGDEDVVVAQFEIPKDVVMTNLRAAQKQGAFTILNPSPALPLSKEDLAAVDILVMNETETAVLAGLPPSSLSGAPADRLFDAAASLAGARHVLITRGARGSAYLSADGRRLEVAAPAAAVVDTTCGGDTFLGTVAGCVGAFVGRARRKCRTAVWDADSDFAAEVRIRDGIERAIRLAHAASKKTVERPGAMTSVPTWSEVDEKGDFDDLLPLTSMKW